MSNYDFATKSQKLAIEHENQNAIVSASAGAGKTFVIIERIIRLVTQNKVGVDGILAVTFTNLAAYEMKEKLKKALVKEYNLTGDKKIKEELDKIPTASISTIHSFCTDVLRKYFYLAKLDANFKVIDEKDGLRLKTTALDKVFEERYESEDEDFYTLLSTIKKGRNDLALKETVFKIYDFSKNDEGLEKLLEKSLYVNENSLTLLKQEVLQDAKITLKRYAEKFITIESLYQKDAVRKNNLRALVDFCQKVVSANSFDEFYKLYKEFKQIPSPSTRLEPVVNEILKPVREEFKKYLQNLFEPFNESQEQKDIKTQKSKVLINNLVQLVRDFASEYENLKAEENAVDFDDIINKTLDLLSSEEEVRLAVKNKYKYIFVDEYQDVNYAQEKLLNLISSDNVFAVGDSKQSIYAFRGCNPEFFIKKFSDYSAGNGGVAYSLDDNFRSAKSIIESVNKVFSSVMTKDTCGLEYKNSPMIYGNGYADFEGSVNVHLVEDEEILDDGLCEGVYSVAKNASKTSEKKFNREVDKIVEIIKSTVKKPYYDIKEEGADKLKSISYGDICILLRSTVSKLSESIVEALLLNNIPVSSGGKKSICGYPEIKALVNLLHAVCFIEDDVALATVLLNFYAFNETQLAQIRKATSKKISLYKSLLAYSEMGEEHSEKVQEFIKDFDKLRLVSAYLPAGDVMSSVVTKSGFDAKILASVGGERKLRRIERFINESYLGDKAMTVKEFENYLKNSLSDLTISESTGEDTVQIMTFHASKGLEFPVVILGGLSKGFNSLDLIGNVIVDRKFGIAPKSFDFENMVVSTNDVRELIKLRYKKQRAVEEARLMYVAMTRAKCQLHVTASKKSVEENRNMLKVLNATCPADFLCLRDGTVVENSVDDKKVEIFQEKIE